MIRQSIITFIFAILFLTSTATATWRLDGWDTSKVHNFRVTSSSTSASAQFSVQGIPLLYDVLKDEAIFNAPIYIVDLRQESHGFANNVPISWYEEHNHANFGKSVAEIQQDEIEKLKSILSQKVEFIPLGKHDEETLNKLTMIVENVQNEKYAVEAVGFKYVRFAAADMIFPEPSTVDEFIKFYLTLPKNHWLHFHCHAGHGRTTTFLVFHDILTYPDLSLEEIVKRQVIIGGTNLLAEQNGTDWYATAHRERAINLRRFYQYVQEFRSSNFATTWSQYLNDNFS